MSDSILRFSYIASKTVNFLVMLDDGTCRKVSDGTFVPCTSANWSSLLHAISAEQTGSAFYAQDLSGLTPAIPAGDITIVFYDATAGAPVFGSSDIGSKSKQWDGSTFVEIQAPSDIGPGSSPNVETIYNTDTGQPVADADAWVSTDPEGNNVVEGPHQTNSLGEVTFMLDPGVQYYLWAQKDGVNPINGAVFTAI